MNPLTGAVTDSIEYDTSEHFPPVCAAGSGAQGSREANGTISAVFRNPNGSKVPTAFDDTATRETFRLRCGSQGFPTLPALAGGTFTRSGAPARK